MKKIFNISNLFLLLLVVHIAKSFIQGATLFDFGVVTLMSLSYYFRAKLDKDIITDKDEIKTIIAQIEEKVNDKMDTLQKAQDNDRLAAESKFSTLILGIQRQSKSGPEKTTYGWGTTR